MTEFTVALAGDTSLGDWYLQRAPDDVQQRLQHEPLSFFEGVSDLVAKNDLFVTNLETVLADNPVSPLEGQKNYLGWDRPERTIQVLQHLGVDAVSLANNHTMDFGEPVLTDTVKRLDEAGIRTFGAGQGAAEAAAPLVERIRLSGQEKNLYILGALKNTRVMREQYNFFASERKWGLHPLATRSIISQLSEIRQNDPHSLIILYPHWGQNYQWSSDLMWRTSERFIDAGTDLIIGHGAHMLQELVSHESGSIAFSLGNFVFNSKGRYSGYEAPPYSLITRLEVRAAKNRWKAALKYYPIVSDNTVTHYRPRPVTGEEAEHVFSVLTHRARNAPAFRKNYSLHKDDRGWHILQLRSISPRLGSGAPPVRRTLHRMTGLMRGERHHARCAPSVAEPVREGQEDETSASPPEPKRYSSGSTQECLAQALFERQIPYQSDTVTIRRTARPAITFHINGIGYAISAARIYLTHESGSVRRRIDSAAGKIVRRKDLANSILAAHGYSTPEGSPFHKSRKAEALLYFDSLHSAFPQGFCIKPVDGGLGRHVYVGINSKEEFGNIFDTATENYDEVLVEETLEGDVYRFLWVGGKISAVRVGVPINVDGDGTSTISELIEIKNSARRENSAHRYYPLQITEAHVNFLARGARTPDTVPAAGETVYLASLSNLEAGADIVDRTDDIHPSYMNLVASAVSSIPEMYVCGADVVIKDPRKPADPRNYAILELNTGPDIKGHHYPWRGRARDVAGDVIDMLMRLDPSNLRNSGVVQ